MDLAARHRHDRRRSILIGLWLAGAVAFVLLAVFAASASRFPGDLWVSRQVREIDSVAFSRAIDWAEDLGDALETTRLLDWKVECSQFRNDFPSCVLLSLTTLTRSTHAVIYIALLCPVHLRLAPRSADEVVGFIVSGSFTLW